MIKKIVESSQQILRYNLDDINNKYIHNMFYFLKNKYACTYFTYMYECFITNKTIYLSNNPEWQEEYISTELINDCHIYKTGFNNSGQNINYVIWEYCLPKNKIELDLVKLRESKDIANGIGFTQQTAIYRESFSFATSKNNINFYKNFLDINILTRILNIFRMCKFK